MRKLTFAIAAIAVLIAASFANGASKAQQIMYGGIWCKTLKGGSVGCVLMSGKGYSVGINKDFVLVQRNGKNVYVRYNK
jgi:hypothetical protein